MTPLGSLLHRTTVLAALLLACAGQAFASGYAVTAQDAAALATADSVVAHSEGPASVFFNPALLTTLPGTQVSIGSAWLHGHNEGGGGSSRVDVFPSTFYVSSKLTDRVSVGLGVNSPFGLATNWGKGWAGRFDTTSAKLQTLDVIPVVAVKVAPGLTVGAGADIMYLDATLQRQRLVGGGELPSKTKADGTGYGYNVGVLYEATPHLSVGATFRSAISVTTNGSASVAEAGVPISARVVTPPRAFAGVSYTGIAPLTLEAGVRWEGWSSFEDQTVLSSGIPIQYVPRYWKDVLGVNAGATYRLSPPLALSVGYLYSGNPVPDETFDAIVPDADTHLFCVGAKYSFEKVDLALSYAYLYLVPRTNAASLLPVPPGEYRSDASMVSVGVNFRF